MRYYPKLAKLNYRFLFGTDFPGVPGVGANAERIAALDLPEDVLENIFINNARRLLTVHH